MHPARRPSPDPRRRLLGAGCGACLGACAAALAAALPAGAAGAADTPALPKLPAVDGSVHDLADIARRHRALVINFWASWCGPCLVELPEFDAVWRELRGRGLAMVGVNAGEKAEKALPFVRQLGLAMPLLLDPQGAAREAFNVFSALPVTAIVDRQGRLRHRIATPISGDALRRLVEPLLREP